MPQLVIAQGTLPHLFSKYEGKPVSIVDIRTWLVVVESEDGKKFAVSPEQLIVQVAA